MHSFPLPQGIFSAQWIPTDAAGAVDRAALAAHIGFERRVGVRGVLALGSTGEFPHFEVAERIRLLGTVAELASGLTLFANISDIRPRAAIEVGRAARSLGYAAVAIMPPMFYPLSQADVLAHSLHVADAVGLPAVLYNFPELCGKRLDLATVAAFADRAPMVAIKQSGGEFAYHRELVALGREKNFAVMSGADTRLAEVFALGAAGCIGGLVNVVPELMVELHRTCALGEPGDAALATARMKEVGRIVDQLAFPPSVGAGVEARGFRPGAPKTILSPESLALRAKLVAELRAAFADWGLAPAHTA